MFSVCYIVGACFLCPLISIHIILIRRIQLRQWVFIDIYLNVFFQLMCDAVRITNVYHHNLYKVIPNRNATGSVLRAIYWQWVAPNMVLATNQWLMCTAVLGAATKFVCRIHSYYLPSSRVAFIIWIQTNSTNPQIPRSPTCSIQVIHHAATRLQLLWYIF